MAVFPSSESHHSLKQEREEIVLLWKSRPRSVWSNNIHVYRCLRLGKGWEGTPYRIHAADRTRNRFLGRGETFS